MDYTKPFKFLKNLPPKLNSFYNKRSSSGVKVSNKSKTKKDFDPVTNFDRAFEKYIRSLINKKFPKDSIIGEEFEDKFSSNNLKWSIDPIDGTRAFVIGAPTWSNLISLSENNKSILGLANFPELNKYYINDKKKSYLFKNNKRIEVNNIVSKYTPSIVFGTGPITKRNVSKKMNFFNIIILTYFHAPRFDH